VPSWRCHELSSHFVVEFDRQRIADYALLRRIAGARQDGARSVPGLAQADRRTDVTAAILGRVRPFLRNNTFFGGLPDSALDAIIARGHTKKYAKGDVLCRRGEPGDSLMVLLAGRVKIANVTSDAREVVLNFLSAGDAIGEIAALDGKERTADAAAQEPCEVFAVHARDLLPVLTAHPAALLEIVQVLCDKLRAASALIEDNTFEMRGRMAKGLLRLAQQHGRTSKEGVRLSVATSQRELGAYLALSRENVSRQLGLLRDAGVIDVAASQIIIKDEQGLALIADPSAKG
jgi:CRP/FNR family transcriptional regulator, cyclic AMP receptor protein